MLLKLALILFPPLLAALLAWGTWITKTSFLHETKLNGLTMLVERVPIQAAMDLESLRIRIRAEVAEVEQRRMADLVSRIESIHRELVRIQVLIQDDRKPQSSMRGQVSGQSGGGLAESFDRGESKRGDPMP